MAIDRRTLIASLGAAVAQALAGGLARAATPTLFAGARTDAAGKASLALFDSTGAELFATELPGRGHDMARAPDGATLVVFARRPGNWAIVVDRTGQVRHTILSSPGRHFFGHGVFTPDGRLLHATENDFDGGRGVIGVYDATDGFRRLGEFPSNGIGPHDVARMPGRDLLAVANGGIQTHPSTGRDILNRDTMAPNLSLVDGSGTVRASFDLGPRLHRSSIRHIAVAGDGAIAFGCQFEGDPDDAPSLVGLVSPDGAVRLFDTPEDDLAALANYVGAVSFDCEDRVVAAACPRGGRVAFWDRDGRYLGSRRHPDGCGIAAAPPEAGLFVITSGNAGVRLVTPSRTELARLGGSELDRWVWDNHLRVV
jgi:hypothetical protein